MLTRQVIVLSPVLALLSVAPSLAEATNSRTINDLEPLLAARPVEGRPIRDFEQFRQIQGASEFVAGILSQKAKAPQWSNAVFALGAIGDEKAKQAVEAFFRNPRDPLTGARRLSPITLNAKVDCLFAFGYMVLHSPDERVRREAHLFLDNASGLSAQLWREIEWESPREANNAARNAYLVSKVRVVMNALRAAQHQPTTHNPPTVATAQAMKSH